MKKGLIFGISLVIFLVTLYSVMSFPGETLIKLDNIRNNSVLLSGNYNVTLNIYSAASGGSTLYTQNNPALNFTSGDAFFTMNGSKSTLDFSGNIYLEFTIENETLDRVLWSDFGVASYSNKSNDANTLDGYDSTQLQRNITGSCAAGNTIRSILWNGSVVCEADSNTEYSAGAGLQLSSTTFSLLWTYLSNFTNDAGFFNTESNLTALLDDNYADISVVDTDTHAAGDNVYIYNTSVISLNESRLNLTIIAITDERDDVGSGGNSSAEIIETINKSSGVYYVMINCSGIQGAASDLCTLTDSTLSAADVVAFVGNWSKDSASYYTSSQVDTALEGQDACSEITGCVENAITDGNTNWDNSYGFTNESWVEAQGYLTSETDGSVTNELDNNNVTVTVIQVTGTDTKILNLEQRSSSGAILTNLTASWTDLNTGGTDTIWAINSTVFQNESGSLGIKRGLFDGWYVALGTKLGNSTAEIKAAIDGEYPNLDTDSTDDFTWDYDYTDLINKPTINDNYALNTSQFLANVTIKDDYVTALCYNTEAELTALLDDNYYAAGNPSGYITDGNTNWDNSYGFTNESWVEAQGYLTSYTESDPEKETMNTSQFLSNTTIKDSYVTGLCYNTEGELTTLLNDNYQPLESTLTDIADGTINENLVNTANPWADNEVADDITIASTKDITTTGKVNATQLTTSNWKIYEDAGGNLIIGPK